MSEKKNQEKLGPVAYISLLIIMAMFSSVMPMLAELHPALSWMKAFDFITLLGKFGSLGELTEGAGKLASDFRGMGGSGPRNAFMVALGLVPSIMVATALIDTAEHYGAIKAAGKLLTPLLKPLWGVPGECAVPIVSGLMSTDAGSITINHLAEEKLIKESHRMILTAFQYSGSGVLDNYFVLGIVCSIYFEIPIIIPLIIILFSKYAGCQLMRVLTNTVIRVDDEEKEENDNEGTYEEN